MTEKEKLIKLLESIPAAPNGNRNVADIANHLLANGVIVPPCKVDDDIYWIDDEEMVVKCAHADVKAVCYYGNGEFKIISRGENEPENIGSQWCMLTKEEAENALAKMKGGAE